MQAASAAAQKLRWWQYVALVVVVLVVMNMAVVLSTHPTPDDQDSAPSPSFSSVLLANADPRLAGWRNRASPGYPQTSLASFKRLVAHLSGTEEEDLSASCVAIVTDPRTFAADCIRANADRATCVEEGLVYHKQLQRLYAAPLRPVIPVPMTEEHSLRSKVLTSHHSVSCWSTRDLHDNVSYEQIVSAGGHCVLLLDAMDTHEYLTYTNEVLAWFLGQEGVDADGGSTTVQHRLLERHPLFMTDVNGRWGEFLDTLRENEVELIEREAWSFILDRDLGVQAEDVFFVYMMYVEDNLEKWRYSIEAMMLSIQKNGGALRRAAGALLVYTPHGEEPPDLDDLAPLLAATNVQLVFRPTPWQDEFTDAWTLHFLKTDVSSYEPAWQRDVVIFLDLDMLILGDIVPYISPRHLRMTPATWIVSMTDEQWQRHGFQGEGARVMHHFGDMEAAYYNSGVMMAPSAIFAAFLEQTEIEAELELEAGEDSLLTRDQLMFEFAHYRLDPPFLELPHDLNVDSNLRVNLGCDALNHPLVYHYHKLELFDGVPEVPTEGACRPYQSLRVSLLSFSDFYIQQTLLPRHARMEDEDEM